MKSRIVFVALSSSLLVAAILAVGTSAGPLPLTARIVDRTFHCTPIALQGELRASDFTAVPIRASEPYDPLQKPSPGFIGVASGGRGAANELVSVRARGWQRFRSPYSPGGAYVSSRHCARSRNSVPLSAAGLPGPAVEWGTEVTCLGRGLLLVRVRAVLQPGSSWQPQSNSFEGARGNVVAATIAVRSARTGKPIAYLELDRDSKTKLRYSASCN